MCLSFLRRRSALEPVSVADIIWISPRFRRNGQRLTSLTSSRRNSPIESVRTRADANLEAINVADGEVVGRRQSSVIGSPLVFPISLPEVVSVSSRHVPCLNQREAMSLPITLVGFRIALASQFSDSDGFGLVIQFAIFSLFFSRVGTLVSTLIGYEFDPSRI